MLNVGTMDVESEIADQGIPGKPKFVVNGKEQDSETRNIRL